MKQTRSRRLRAVAPNPRRGQSFAERAQKVLTGPWSGCIRSVVSVASLSSEDQPAESAGESSGGRRLSRDARAHDLDRQIDRIESGLELAGEQAGPGVEELEERPEDRWRPKLAVAIQPVVEPGQAFVPLTELDLRAAQQAAVGGRPR